VEDRIGSARSARALAIGQRLIGAAHRRLQGVQNLGELKACKALGVEPSHAILAVKTVQSLDRDGEEIVDRKIRFVKVESEPRKGAAIGRIRGDREMTKLLFNEFVYRCRAQHRYSKLLFNEFVYRCCARRVAQRA